MGTTILQKLQVAQKWVIKVMLFKGKLYPTELVYKDSQLFSPFLLYIKSIIRFMLKYDYYKVNVNHGINTRFATDNNVILQNPHHNICRDHIYCVGPKLYNMLPLNVKTKPYFKVKEELNKWISENGIAINCIT